MLKRFYPYNFVESPFVIDYGVLYEKGYRGIIFDIDNTLVHHGDDPTDRTDGLFRDLSEIGFKLFILSNNSSERIERFLKNVSVPYISEAGKPDPKNYAAAAEAMGVGVGETIMIGDQVYTDVLGANRCGMASILVDYIRAENETRRGKKRLVESVVLRLYRKNRSMYQRLGNITFQERK